MLGIELSWYLCLYYGNWFWFFVLYNFFYGEESNFFLVYSLMFVEDREEVFVFYERENY